MVAEREGDIGLRGTVMVDLSVKISANPSPLAINTSSPIKQCQLLSLIFLSFFSANFENSIFI